MKSMIKFTAALVLAMSGFGCSELVGPDQRDLPGPFDIIYSTSFESPKDTVGWLRYGSMSFDQRVPPGGGRQSVLIAGGCIHPHTALLIAPPPHDSYITLSAWVKNLAIGGAVELSRVTDRTKRISIMVSDPTWSHHVSPDTLFCPGGEALVLEMSSGGFAPSSMLVDLLEVRRID